MNPLVLVTREHLRDQTGFSGAADGAQSSTHALPRTLVRLAIGGLVALTLLVVGELAPGLFPLAVTLRVADGQVVVQADGSENAFKTPRTGSYAHVQFVQPGPAEREIQIDGSDVTSRKDRNPDEVRAWTGTLYYHLAGWLRDEDSYSRWEGIRLTDVADGRVVAEGREAVEAATLPSSFQLEASLRGPEAITRIDLTTDDPVSHGILEISRDSRYMRWLTGPTGHDQTARWYYPKQPAPFAAELFQLLGRSAALGYFLLVAAFVFGQVIGRLRLGWTGANDRLAAVAIAVVSVAWLAAAGWVSFHLYHQLPHIVDAAAYYFEMNVLRTGHLWLQPPPLAQYFRGYFETTENGRWFAQYPPGGPAVYAVSSLAGLAWLMGPLCGLVLILASAFAAWQLFGPKTGLAALLLGSLSPFILFQSGSFMSHPVAGAALGVAFAAFAYAERTRRIRWYLATGALLGWGLLTRELSTVLFGLPLVTWLAANRRWRGLGLLLAAGIPFVLVYLAYNAQLTGDPFLLPRNAINASDRYGFGDFGDEQNTLAAGLVYTDENLTILQFDLFGWPPLFAFGVLLMPFLLGRPNRYDLLLGGALLVYMAGYVGVPGAGIVLGPRYYYEALPFVLVLAARGLQRLVGTLRSLGLPTATARAGVFAVVGLLTLNTVLFYDPHLVQRRTDYFAMDHNWGVSVPFVTNTFFGPQLTGFSAPTLVLVPDDVVFKTLSSLNCPALDKDHIQNCPVLFAWAGHDHAAELAQAYPGRTLLEARLVNNQIVLQPYH